MPGKVKIMAFVCIKKFFHQQLLEEEEKSLPQFDTPGSCV
jgi:hypothetical protein